MGNDIQDYAAPLSTDLQSQNTELNLNGLTGTQPYDTSLPAGASQLSGSDHLFNVSATSTSVTSPVIGSGGIGVLPNTGGGISIDPNPGGGVGTLPPSGNSGDTPYPTTSKYDDAWAALLKKYEKNGDGALSEAELGTTLYRKMMKYNPNGGNLTKSEYESRRAAEDNKGKDPFTWYDVNGDGTVDQKDIDLVAGADKSAWYNFINKYDVNGDTKGNGTGGIKDNKVTRAEYNGDIARAKGNAFQKLDKNGDGVLTASELHNIGQYDMNGDGQVSEDEYDFRSAVLKGKDPFAKLDVDNDGYITMKIKGKDTQVSRDEYFAMEKQKLSDAYDRATKNGKTIQVSSSSQAYDADNNGTLSKDEYIAWKMKDFQNYDGDHNGKISKAELIAGLSSMYGIDFDSHIAKNPYWGDLPQNAKYDGNQDGTVSRQEYINYMLIQLGLITVSSGGGGTGGGGVGTGGGGYYNDNNSTV